jgi:hypothetical protein
MKKPGWGVIVQGEPTDLEDWAYTLKEPFNPWVEVNGDQTVLRSALFDELKSAAEVRDWAIMMRLFILDGRQTGSMFIKRSNV